MRPAPFDLTLADKPIASQVAPDGTLWEKYAAQGMAHYEGRSFKVKPVELWVSDWGQWAAASEYVKAIMGKAPRNLSKDRDGIFIDRIDPERSPSDGGQAVWPLDKLFHIRVLYEQHKGRAMERFRQRKREERRRMEGCELAGAVKPLW